MKYLLGLAGVGAIVIALLLSHRERPRPVVVDEVAPSGRLLVDAAPSLSDASVQEKETPSLPSPDAGTRASAKGPPLAPPTARTQRVARRSPEAWQAVNPLLLAWFPRRSVPEAARILEDACANMGSVGADSIDRSIEGMRDGGVFDSKLYHAAIEERARILAGAVAELTTLSNGKFANHELDQLYQSSEFSRACPTLGMNHDDDDDDEPSQR